MIKHIKIHKQITPLLAIFYVISNDYKSSLYYVVNGQIEILCIIIAAWNVIILW